jgi:hypothetical protein
MSDQYFRAYTKNFDLRNDSYPRLTFQRSHPPTRNKPLAKLVVVE